ncbi:carboxylesterase [Pseudacidovorax sp. RU35E]|uniref:alpha/beta hydrolase n=1 Tax=Pseudacidovorax sp. RU35E TaxID=1907403 RepID=UPI000956BE20|nr:alpha/beta fold hydrolase [Pseudacidovorax sp. RU35E]SIQ57925.1 carboxylesterase [Pseudacidovorax sp. RU35E]
MTASLLSAAAPASPGAVLLLPGLCSTPDELLHLQSALRRSGWHVSAPHIAGYSFDADRDSQRASGFAQWVDRVCAEFERLKAQHGTVLLAGISAGAALALAAVARLGKAVAGVVLMSTTLRMDGWSVRRSRWLLPLALYTPIGLLWRYRERAPYGVKNQRVREWIEQELKDRRISRAGCAAIGVGHLREYDRLRRAVRRSLDRVQCPVLALHAREDEVASLSNIDLLANGIKHAPLHTVVLENSYHMISIDNDRRQVAEETIEFARTVAQGRAPSTPTES